MELCLAKHGAHVDYLTYCPDHPDNPGPNRKPAPGMANQLLEYFGANANETWFVGDSLSDIECALNAGCQPALVLTGKGEKTSKKTNLPKETPIFKDLASFVDQLLN